MEPVQPTMDRQALTLTPYAENFLITAARWAKFIGILSYILSGIMLVFSVAFIAMGSLMPVQAMPQIMMAAIYIPMAAIYILIGRYLCQFGSKTQRALTSRSEEKLEQGFKSLKNHFLMIGILSIIAIALMFVGIFVVIVAVAAGAIPGMPV